MKDSSVLTGIQKAPLAATMEQQYIQNKQASTRNFNTFA